ncbi:fatty-acid amide hydrolase 2-B-like isoform X2 [Athalia rosae]|uniref:fatty-acid amide hydrolase 2-B-like isoform X2 n=1 Tax=Athalia rosae TaxID=37344 RepID=UPI0020337CF4|nr:fatty-acid amide hydrolase 2-B-like isoform X2 [Athalia rosae]
MELIIRILTFLESVIYHILRPVFWWVYRKQPPKIALIKNPILQLSAVKIAEKIRQKELSSETVILAYIERIKEVNPLLNAVVENRFEAAIQDARACDKKLATGEVTAKELEIEKPLFGVPVTVKESCALKGLSHTGCTLARAGIKANYDSLSVLSLKTAGAIPLCVTNTPELCLGFESQNPLFGTTNNPYDIRKTAGGSSGGEGALLGSSSSLIGVGSDIAGSIRLPAHLNGVFGHKPTPGIISIEGHLPFCDGVEFQKYLVIGPLARYAEDLALAVKVMANRNTAALRLDEPVDVKSLKIRYMEAVEESFGLISVSEDIKRVIRDGARYLEGIGADVERVMIPELTDSLDIGMALFFGMKEMPQLLLDPEDPKHESNPISELGKLLFGLSRHNSSAILFKLLRDVHAFIPQSKLPSYRGKVQKLERIFTELLGTNGVFLFPTFVRSAPLHDQLTLQLAGALYCLIFNVLGFPATHVPMGLDSEGLPVGVQVRTIVR